MASTSIVLTFSPFHLKVSPALSLKYSQPNLSMTKTSPDLQVIYMHYWKLKKSLWFGLPEEHVTFPPNISDDLLITWCVIRVSMIVPDRMTPVYSTNKFSCLSTLTHLSQTTLIPVGIASIFVDLDDAQWKQKWEENWYKANSTNSKGYVFVNLENLNLLCILVAEVTTAAVALCGPIELIYLTNVESGHKLLPNLRSQPIAKHHSYTVLFFMFGHRCCVQVAGNLSNILCTLKHKWWWFTTMFRICERIKWDYRDFVFDTIFPEFCGREFLSCDSSIPFSDSYSKAHMGSWMVHWQYGVENIIIIGKTHTKQTVAGK